MCNGENYYGVKYSQIQFFEKILETHKNVYKFDRHHDIVFDIERVGGDRLKAICLNEYTCGLARVMEVISEFPEINLIYVGGMWNGFTAEAKDFCLDSKIGLYNTTEMTGALFYSDFWAYRKKDKD